MKAMGRITAGAALVLCAQTGWAAEEERNAKAAGRQQYIVMSRRLFAQPNASAPAAVITDEEIAAVGGTAEARGSDRVIVSLPEAAVEGVRRHPGVKYVQRGVVGPEPVVRPALSSGSGVGSGGLRRETAGLRSGLEWSSGGYVYDAEGNVKQIGTTQAYTYDSAARLVQAKVGTNVERYRYDGFGNLVERVTNGTSWPIATDPATNRLGGVSYDTAGNVTAYGTASYAWDPFNRMREQNGGNGSAQVYVYTASDERIGVLEGERWIWSLRDESGKVLRQYDSLVSNPQAAWRWIGDYVYREGQLLGAERMGEEGGRRHFHLDHLGTPRLITGEGGLKVSEHEYYPFGNEITPWQGQQAGFDREEPKKFTGHERDFTGGTQLPNTNYLDYMHARFYNPNLGRFLSVDPGGWDPKNPQSWNRYSYALNNPVNKIDPDGRNPVGALIGGFIGVGVESIRQVRSGEAVNNRRLVAALLGGGAAGAIGGFGATSLRGAMGFGALGNVTGGVIDRGVSGEKVFTSAMVLDATTGVAGGGAGFKLGQVMVGASGTSGELNELAWKAAAQRAEAAAGNLGLGADKETVRQAQEIIKGITAAGDVGGNVTGEVIKSEHDQMKKALEEQRRRERDQLP